MKNHIDKLERDHQHLQNEVKRKQMADEAERQRVLDMEDHFKGEI